MPRLQALLESVGQALAEKGRKAFTGDRTFGDVLPDVSRTALDYCHKHLSTDEIRVALGEAAAAGREAYKERLDRMMAGLCRVQSVPFKDELTDYLSFLPNTVRQVFRRPSDVGGTSPPSKLDFYKPEHLLQFLPPRRPRFKLNANPAGLDHWELHDLRGLGECSEVWAGDDADQPEHSPAALKFVIDPESRERVAASQELFAKVFELNDVAGVVPLRSVFLDTDPPCLESAFVAGYDLTGLMYDWKWKFDSSKPEAALKLVRRVADILAKAHEKGVVHRDLKPSNVLLHPTEGGKFTVWVTDFGWGQIESARSLELARGGTPRGEQMRLALRGAHTPLYASPQQQKKEAPDPRDDVHAVGVIWYQLLKRDPHAAAPVGDDWAKEFEADGLTESQAKLLTQCVATRPDKRPANATALAEMLHRVTLAPLKMQTDDGSKLISLKSTDTPFDGVSLRGRSVGMDAAARAAAAMLAGGNGGMASAAGTTHGMPKLVRNSTGMTFAYVPAGEFQMGSPEDEPGRREHEGPRHPVKITRPFYLGLFPVTQGQYEKVTGKNPAFFRHGHGGPDFPVESVGWAEADKFCRKLAKLPEEQQNGRTYRLPTEAEWEYACRAGTTGIYACGDKLAGKDAHFLAPNFKGQGKPSAVGRYPANPLGLFDLHGNVWEWVADWYDEYYYFDTPPADPHGPAGGQLKVARGGSWASPATECRAAARHAHAPDRPDNTIGFRVVMLVDGMV